MATVPATVRCLRPELRDTLPSLGPGRHEAETCEERILVADARKLVEGGDEVFSLDTHGFVLTRLETTCPRFEDKALVREVYYPEISDLVKRTTGCERAVVISHLVRTGQPAAGLGGADKYIRYAHIDYTDAFCRQAAPGILSKRAGVPLASAEEDYDYVYYNVWQPIYHVVEQNPLALLDARTLSTGDIQKYQFEGFGGDYRGDVVATIICANPLHRWYYFPFMRPDEVLVFIGHKQQLHPQNDAFRQVAHFSFWDPSAPSAAADRTSVELRVLAATPKKMKKGNGGSGATTGGNKRETLATAKL